MVETADNTPRSNLAHYVRCLKCNKILKCSRYDTTCLLDHIRLDHPEIEIVESITQPTRNVPQTTNKKCPSPPKPKKGCCQSAKVDNHNNNNNIYGSFDDYNDDINNSFGVNNGNGGNRIIATVRQKRNSVSDDDIAPENAACKCGTNEQTTKRKSNSAQTVPAVQTYSKHGDEIKVCASDPCDAKLIYTRKYKSKITPHSDYKKKLYRTSIQKWKPAEGSIYCPKCGCRKRPVLRTHAERSSTNSCCAALILSCWPFCFIPYLCPQNTTEYLHCSNCKNFLGLYDRNSNCVKPNREYIEFVEETNTEVCNCGPEA